MDFIVNGLRRNLYGFQHRLLFFENESKRVENIVKAAVVNGESNSLLIVGRRGVGKQHLVREAIKRIKNDISISTDFLEVHLNGLVHTDDRSALRSLAKQLHKEADLESLILKSDENVANTLSNDGVVSMPFSQQLYWLLVEVGSGNKKSKPIVIILHEFDLFALHRNQILLYNLFDCCQANGTPICIIGLTCRLDIMELLEKRVKSRFSHRQIHLISPAAPMDNCDSYDDNTDQAGSKSVAFKQYCSICQHLLTIDTDDSSWAVEKLETLPGKARRELETAIRRWNHHIAELMTNEIVIDSLRQAWSISVSIRRLKNLLIPIVASLNSKKDSIEAVEFIDSLCSLRQDAKTNSLKGLAILELFLITAIVKLQDINDGQAVNFEILYTEYAKFCRTQCPSYLYDKPVVSKALDNLIDLELIVSGKEAVLSSSHPSKAGTLAGLGLNATIQLPNYRPLFCFVDADTLSSCLDAYPNCPVELKFWARSRTF